MKKNNSLVSKALNEADTIRAGAMKNAHEILFNTFQPKIKSLFNEVLKEQVGVVNQDPMDGPNPAKYDQDKADADLENPQNAMHQQGDGPELLEDEGIENPDELPEQGDEEIEITDELPEQDDMDFEELPEQDDMEFDELPEQDDMEFEELPEQDDIEVADEELPEQDDFELEELPEQDDMDFEELPEQDDIEIADEELPEQDDFELDELPEQDDIEVVDDELPEQDDIEVTDEELPEQDDIEIEELPEQVEVNPTMDQDVKKLANENKQLKVAVNNLRKRNKELTEGVMTLRKKIAEVALFNAKVGAANKITNSRGLSEAQKIKMLEAFDKCKNIREVKLTYTNFKNFIRSLQERKKVSESKVRMQRTLSSKNVVTAKKSSVMSEDQRKTLKLAGILS